MRVCIFGDSIGKGVVYDPALQRYVPLQNSFINRLAEEKGFTVENYCRFGGTVTHGVGMIEKAADRIGEADLVLLEFGGNDSDYDWKKIAAAPEEEHIPRTPIAGFVETYRRAVGLIRGLGKTPFLFNLPPVDAGKYFSWISRGLSESNILKWLSGDRNYIYRWHEMYSAAICDLCVSEGLPMIDVRSPFLVRRDYSDFLCEDGIHPNVAGHEMMAGCVSGALKALL